MKISKIMVPLAVLFCLSCGAEPSEKTSEVKFIDVLITPLVGWSGFKISPGYVGYVYKVPRFIKRSFVGANAEYVGVYEGPYRRTFFGQNTYHIVLIDKQWTTYTEKFNILAKDELNVSFSSHMRIRPKSDEASVRLLVENFGGKSWYEKNVKEPVRTTVRDAVQRYKATEIKGARTEIEQEIREELEAYFANKPFEIDTVSVGNLDYPDVVEKAVERKLAREQELAEEAIKVQISERKKQIRLIEAQAEAESQALLRENVTEDIIMLRWIESMRELAKSENKVFYFMPIGEKGIPIFANIDADKVPKAKKD